MNKLKLLTVAALTLSLAACQAAPGGQQDGQKESEAPTSQESKPAKTDSGAGVKAPEEGTATPAVALADVDIDDEEAWQQEEAYGQKIKVVYAGGLCTAPAGIALSQGFYEDEGLDVELVKSEGASADAVGTGQAQVGADHITSILVPLVNGVNAQIVGGVHTGCKSLYVMNDSDIESTEDLKGQTIAIHNGIGQSDHNIALRFLKADGITAEEVNFKDVDTSATIQAMENGELQGSIFTDQFAQPFVEEGKLRRIRGLSFDEDFKDETCCAIVVNKDFAKENPITAKKMGRAIRKAANWVEDNKEDFIEDLFANNWASGDKDAALAYAKTLNFAVPLESTGETVEHVINDYKALHIFNENEDTAAIMKHVWSPADSHNFE